MGSVTPTKDPSTHSGQARRRTNPSFVPSASSGQALRPWSGHPALSLLVRFGVALVAATGAGLLFAALVMRAPPEDVGQLALILVASGAVSLIAGGALVRWSGTRRHGLRLRLAALYGAGLVVMAINVLGAARLMFLSAHDL